MPHYLLGPGMEDPREPIHKLLRHELEAILAAENIDAPQDVPAFTARYMLFTAGVDVTKYIGPDGEFIKPTPKPGAVNVDEMKMGELRSYCAKAKIPYTLKDKKVELQERIRNWSHG